MHADGLIVREQPFEGGTMNWATLRYAACSALLAALAGCGGSSDSGGSGMNPSQQTGTLSLMVSDATADDWATVGVNVLSIALIPQGGGSNVTVYTAGSGTSYVNLEQLDQLGEILGNVSVPADTYTGAVITVGANPGDIQLVTSEDPEAGFAAPAGSSIASADIQIQGASGTSGTMTVPINVNFVSPLTVTASSSKALDLEFDLAHPAFIVAHQPPGAGTVLWAVNFDGPVRHRPIADITRLVLRHMYASLGSVSSDGSTLNITRVYATRPIVNPETAVTGAQMLGVMVDSTNGTLFYDVDAGTGPTTIKSFSNVTGLSSGQYLRIQARYQQNGTLTATRIWASSQFNSVWVSPEGHVNHVDTANNVIWVSNESGTHVPVSITANTEFTYHGGATVIGTGPAFLTAGDLVRGFKVHVNAVDPLQTPLVAQSVDIETAAYSGAISLANASNFTYTHDYVRASDDYSIALDYATAGTDVNGKNVNAFDYWNFAYPTLTDSTVNDFVQATTSALTAVGWSAAVWGDPANMSGWSARNAILLPVPVGLATVSSTGGLSSDNFGITTLTSSTGYTVDFSTTSGQATLVYQVARNNGIVTVSPVDITTASGLTDFENALMASGTLVKVFALPTATGSLQAYVVFYYSGTMPSS
jgi:hypothetical protein